MFLSIEYIENFNKLSLRVRATLPAFKSEQTAISSNITYMAILFHYLRLRKRMFCPHLNKTILSENCHLIENLFTETSPTYLVLQPSTNGCSIKRQWLGIQRNVMILNIFFICLVPQKNPNGFWLYILCTTIYVSLTDNLKITVLW